MTFDRWVRTFKPIYQGDRAGWGGYAIENFREIWPVIVGNDDRKRLWTGTVDDDSWNISPGISIVNRECYFICEVPYTDDFMDLYVRY